MSTKLKIYTKPKEQRENMALPLDFSQQELLPVSSANSVSSNAKSNANGKNKNANKSQKLRCLARTANKTQCVRPQSEGSDFCTCHTKHCPYGRFNGPIEGKKWLSVPQKKGPKFRDAPKDYTLEELDPDLYVALRLIQIDGQNYLIDDHGLLFANNAKGEIVGHQEGDLIKWFV